MKKERKAKFRGVTVSAVAGLNGILVDFLGGSPFVWLEDQIRPLTDDERQLALPLSVRP